MYTLHRTNLTCVFARRKTWEKADHEASSGCLRGRGRQAGSLFTWGPGPGPAALDSCTAQGSAGSRILWTEVLLKSLKVETPVFTCLDWSGGNVTSHTAHANSVFITCSLHLQF